MTGTRRTPAIPQHRSLSTWILVAALVTIPLFLTPFGQDAFRLPKELLVRFAAILLLVCAILWLSQRGFAALRTIDARPPLVISVLSVLWSFAAVWSSTNRSLSLTSAIWIVSCAIFFWGSWFTAPSRTIVSIEWIAIPVGITILIYASQQFEIWRPFGIQDSSTYHGSPALLGTPDDVAIYLVPATLASLALWRAGQKRSSLHLAIGAASAATVFWTRTLTAVVALVFALFVAALLITRRRRYLIAAALIVITIPFAFPLLRGRIAATVTAGRTGNYDEMFAGRALPWASALEMVKADPWTGVGPGCYSWQYFPFRRVAESKAPVLLSARMRHSNFGEAHNDQLQLAATAGIPALVLFLTALWLLAKTSFVDQGDTAESRFSKVAGAPLAVAIFILTLAQFPLELAAPTTLVLYLAGSITGWSRES